jgi:siroheme synthase-like protein
VQDPDLGSFPVALNLRRRAVLVVGGGDEAAQKVPRLRAAGAQVTIVAPEIAPSLEALSRSGLVRWYVRDFAASDVVGVDVVLLTLLDPARASELSLLSRRARFWLCAIDQPDYSDFFLVSTVTRGPVQIAISTGGRAPLLARRLRQALDRALDANFSEFARSFAALRARVRALPKPARSEVLERALAGFAMEVSLRYPEQDGHDGHVSLPPDEAHEQ